MVALFVNTQLAMRQADGRASGREGSHRPLGLLIPVTRFNTGIGFARA